MKKLLNVPSDIPKEAFLQLLPIFFEEIEQDFEEIKKLNKTGEISGIRKLTHKIKGTSASYGALHISNTAMHLQEVLDNGKNNLLEKGVSELDLSIRETKEYVQKEFI